MGSIKLENLEFFAFHGWYEEEQRVGTRFTVNVSFDAELAASGSSDDLADTVDYQQVLAIVQAEMAIPSKLIEHVGQRIIDRVQQALPGIQNVVLELVKHRPFPNQPGDVRIVLKGAKSVADN